MSHEALVELGPRCQRNYASNLAGFLVLSCCSDTLSSQVLSDSDNHHDDSSSNIENAVQGILNFIFDVLSYTLYHVSHTRMLSYFDILSCSTHLQSTKLLELGNHAIDVLDLTTTLSLCWLSNLESLQSLLSTDTIILHLLLLKLLLLRLHDVW